MYSEAESRLIALCLQGKRQAQHSLYHRYCDAMYNVCHRMLGNETEAQDALQEAFIDVFSKLHTFREESSLGAWIKRIVINHCLNIYKRRKIQIEELHDRYTDIPETISLDDGEMQYEIQKVKHAIMKLPDGYRQVLTLYLIEGYDHGEIAGILGIQETGSKSQYSRAKAKLREMLKGEG
jgi:RNA polymerase sigma-70 factor (ECF subfamily)